MGVKTTLAHEVCIQPKRPDGSIFRTLPDPRDCGRILHKDTIEKQVIWCILLACQYMNISVNPVVISLKKSSNLMSHPTAHLATAASWRSSLLALLSAPPDPVRNPFRKQEAGPAVLKKKRITPRQNTSVTILKTTADRHGEAV